MFYDKMHITDSSSVESNNLFSRAPPHGIPWESKLVSYMSCQNNSPPYTIASDTSNLSVESPLLVKKTNQLTHGTSEFTGSRINSSPSFYSPFSGRTSHGTNGTIGNSSLRMGNNPYSSTPLKGVRNMMGGDSPQTVVESPRLTPQPSQLSPPLLSSGIHQENVGGTTYFYPANHSAAGTSEQPTIVNFKLPDNVYPGPASNIVSMQPRTQLSAAFFNPDSIRGEILLRNMVANQFNQSENEDLPSQVGKYYELCRLEPPILNEKISLANSTTTYKAVHFEDGLKYCLRRLHGFRIQSTKCTTVIDMWKKLQHSNVVQLRDAFTTKIFNDNSLVFVYDYHPSSVTLLAKYFTPASDLNGYIDPFQGEAGPFGHKSHRTPNGPCLPENDIWSIVMQLTAGLRAIHQSGLACRTLDPTKIIVTGKRIRFSFVGISDIIFFDPNQTNQIALISNYQQEDLTALGKLILALACRNLHSVQEDNIQTSINLVARQYSQDLRNLIVFLLNTSNQRAVTDLMPMIGARFYAQIDAMQCQNDKLEDELSKEMENGRLYRLLVKLGTIVDRPILNMDNTWGETGDRYLLMLFRDYLFHSVTDDGRPWLDNSHIVQCLNKLDAGTLDKIQLVSRDEQSVLVVTYAELKVCFEKSFAELMSEAM